MLLSRAAPGLVAAGMALASAGSAWATGATTPALVIASAAVEFPVVVGRSPDAAAGRRAFSSAMAALTEGARARAEFGGDAAAVRDFYARRDQAPIWLDPVAGRAKARALVAALLGADADALPTRRYRAGDLSLRLGALGADAFDADPKGAAALEAALTRAYLAYARDISSGALKPSVIDPEIHVFPHRQDAALLLAAALNSMNMERGLSSLAPQSAEYTRLKAAYKRMRGIVASGGWGAEIPHGPTLREGDTGPRVAMLRARLDHMGYLAPYAPVTKISATEIPITEIPAAVIPAAVISATEIPVTKIPAAVIFPARMPAGAFDAGLRVAVETFQTNHGLDVDGAVGPATLRALNIPAVRRAEQIGVNLERRRWLGGNLGKRHILVNQADFSIQLIENDHVTHRARVIVGRSNKFRTPEFNDMMTYMVVNPTWHVPRSIIGREILPKLKKNPGYLAEKNMRLVSAGGEGPDPYVVDWSEYSASSFPYGVKQEPGPGNALGRIKFIFPNQFNIYLHDTPSKRLFARSKRDFSHGCVRLQNPFDFAELLLDGQQANSHAYLAKILGEGKERVVSLRHPVPVHLTYLTVRAEGPGALQFRADIYKRDAEVAAALAAAGVEFR